MRSSRRRFLLSAASVGTAAVVIRYPGDAAEFTFKFGMASAITQPPGARAAEACKRIESDSGGRLQVQLFPRSALGDNASMLSQVRTGAIQIFGSIGLDLASVVPLCALEGIAFAFPTYEKIYEAWDGPLGNTIRNGIRAAGMYTFDKVWMVGYQNLMNSRRPVIEPADVAGMKIRVTPAPTEVAIWKALGVSIVALNGPEVYPALQTHLVDGLVTGLSALDGLKWYEMVKYISMTHHAFASQTIVANNDAMQALPKELREIVDRNLNASALDERADMTKLEDSLQKTFTDRGLQVNKPDLAAFRAAIRKAGLYGTWRTQFGAPVWSQLEKTTGPLA